MVEKPRLSIVVPVYNENDCFQEMFRRVSEVMDTTKESWEMIVIDDGSRDGSTDQIRELGITRKVMRLSSLTLTCRIHLKSSFN
jgi:dolichol-phosphate mannosyltransferase